MGIASAMLQRVVLLLAFAAVLAAGSACYAQTQVSRVTSEGVPGNRGSQSDIKPSRRATPEIQAVSPTRMLPAAAFDVTLTGKNLLAGMPMWLDCHQARDGKPVDDTYFKLEAKSVTVKDANSVVAHFESPKFPSEAICDPASTAGRDMHILIGAHANDPRQLAGTFIAEGASLDAMTMAMKMRDVAQRYTKEKLLMTPARVQYIQQDGKPLFDRPISDIKSVGPVLIGGNPSGMFLIVFSDGKAYNFAPMGQGEDAMKALGKK